MRFYKHLCIIVLWNINKVNDLKVQVVYNPILKFYYILNNYAQISLYQNCHCFFIVFIYRAIILANIVLFVVSQIFFTSTPVV